MTTSGALKIEKFFLDKCRNEGEFNKNILSMKPHEIREIRRKPIIPMKKNIEELYQDVKLKKSWKNPGPGNTEFEKLKGIKGIVLDYWTASRVTMPEKSYARYPISKAVHAGFPGKEFGNDKEGKLFTEQYKNLLEKHKMKFNEFVERPSKFDKKEYFLTELINPNPKFIIKKPDNGEFRFQNHSAFICENKYRIKK